MTQLLLRLFNISVTAGWIVLAVIVVRLVFHKMPRWGYCLLWGIVGLRLLLPVTPESDLSLLPSPALIPQDIAAMEAPAIQSGIPAVNRVINPIFVADPVGQLPPLELLLQVASWVWLAGAAVLLAYGLFSYGRLCRQVRISVRREDDVYLCDEIQSPFLLGIFKPRIYVPSGLEADQLPHILAHERAHIRRRDHLWKPLGFLLLCVYWFNPLLWAGYILLCRDIERACDEKVIKNQDNLFRLQYMDTLLSCSLHRRMILACPVAFGEVSVKTRVKGIVRYKKPTFVVLLTSVLLCVAACVCFLTTPKACAHEYTSQTTQSATCTEHGLQTNTCRLCSHTYMQTTACLAHNYDQGQCKREATCTRTGIRVRHCTDCGRELVEEIPMTEHTPGTLTVTKEANCVESGTIRSACTVCRVYFIVERPAPNGAHNIRRTVIREPDCTEAGLAEELCTYCGMREEIVLEPLGHNYKTTANRAAACSWSGYKLRECTRCDHEIIIELPPDLENHSFDSFGLCRNCYCRRSSSTSLHAGLDVNNTITTSRVPENPVIRWDPYN